MIILRTCEECGKQIITKAHNPRKYHPECKIINAQRASRDKRRHIRSVWTPEEQAKHSADAMRCRMPIRQQPKWANQNAIYAVYVEAIRKTKETGIPHVVDHVIPLKHLHVCGLHVEYNLQVITHGQNTAKGNYFNRDSI